MPPASDPLSDVIAHYAAADEPARLQRGASQLEAARTRELIRRHAPPAPATVLDVGGGGGAYAFWLASLGYAVHLVDLVPRHVAHAERVNAAAAAPLASLAVGDARRLDRGDASAEVVLLLGPLYHLPEAAGRAAALAEAARVLRPGGWLFAAAISRFASALDGLARDLFADPAFGPIVARDLATGEHRNDAGHPDYFTTAYFHRPDELAAEVATAGLAEGEVFGIEGPGWLFDDFEARWANERRRADLLRVAQALEAEPSIRGASAHLLAVARKPS
ncbi:MAG: class I SAM-dependent methyltransferase [Rubricoccaceae bacterium]|nr:class I SAM-dependent methyltransferase [Rubricoccaceae bacterium]